MVEFLIDGGAAFDAKEAQGRTPLETTRRHSHPKIVKLLEEAAVAKQQGHAGKIDAERKDKGPPKIGG
jgi:ankyrin repeat protein